MKKEFMEKAKQAKSVEELLALAKENGIEMDEAQAKEMLEKLAKLTDEELDEVAGGLGLGLGGRLYFYDAVCPECGNVATLSTGSKTPPTWTCNNCLEAGKIVHCKVYPK